MKYVKFVSGLITERVPKFGPEEREYVLFPNFLDDGSTLGMSAPINVTSHTIPIVELCGIGDPDTYVAYSKEVEIALGIPIRSLVQQRDDFKRTAARYMIDRDYERDGRLNAVLRLEEVLTGGFWGRLRFIVTGRY